MRVKQENGDLLSDLVAQILVVTSHGQSGMVSVINRDGPRSLHKRLRDALCEDIRRGKYRPGQAIPSERVLCETWGVSRTTVRLAGHRATVFRSRSGY